jgi:hypothetical protein
MIEFFVTTVVALGLTMGVITEVVEPAANYAIDQGKAGVEYIEEKLGQESLD